VSISLRRSSYWVADRRCSFTHAVLVDKTPLPDHIPKVEEVGASSAPLTSAAFFIGDRCKAYNEDYMLCKHEAKGKGEVECLKEGRRVTRCAASVYVVLHSAAHVFSFGQMNGS
jgi:NADH dehydrogenase (ubiquinone) 1 alpha subcomplex subunit 8